MAAVAPVVTISYQDLVDFDTNKPNDALVEAVGEAFDANGLGIVAVVDLPESVADQRRRLLELAAKLPFLPDLNDCVKPSTLYSVGWSHGKEQLAPGKPDFGKGSYYANPLRESLVEALTDRDGRRDHWQEQADKHPSFYADNVWPKSLPDLQPAFLELGQTVAAIGRLLARVCDVYCRKQGVATQLESILTRSLNAKGRLLHYFDASTLPSDDKMWCGWHNDHGAYGTRGSLHTLSP